MIPTTPPTTWAAGPDLDAEIHERVMGGDPSRCGPLCPREFGQDEPGTGPCPHVPAYSTDIRAAWDVVEHMKAKPFSVRRRFMLAIGAFAPTGSRGERVDPLWLLFFVTPELLCRAALQAVAGQPAARQEAR